MRNFRTYDLAVELYRQAQKLCLPRVLRDQLDRASLSVVLNLAEGDGRGTRPDRRRFFQMAMGSLRETMAILELANEAPTEMKALADCVGAHLYKLIKYQGR
jgi:four helix bundle protein